MKCFKRFNCIAGWTTSSPGLTSRYIRSTDWLPPWSCEALDTHTAMLWGEGMDSLRLPWFTQ